MILFVYNEVKMVATSDKENEWKNKLLNNNLSIEEKVTKGLDEFEQIICSLKNCIKNNTVDINAFFDIAANILAWQSAFSMVIANILAKTGKGYRNFSIGHCELEPLNKDVCNMTDLISRLNIVIAYLQTQLEALRDADKNKDYELLDRRFCLYFQDNAHIFCNIDGLEKLAK